MGAVVARWRDATFRQQLQSAEPLGRLAERRQLRSLTEQAVVVGSG